MAASNIVAFPGTASTPRQPDRGKGTTVMRSDLVEAASKVITEPPLLINLVSRRVKQLNQGRSALVQVEPRMGAADIALKEIIEGKIAPEFPDGVGA